MRRSGIAGRNPPLVGRAARASRPAADLLQMRAPACIQVQVHVRERACPR